MTVAAHAAMGCTVTTYLQEHARGACSLRLRQEGARTGKPAGHRCDCALGGVRLALAGALAGRSRSGSAASARAAFMHLHRQDGHGSIMLQIVTVRASLGPGQCMHMTMRITAP